MQKTEFAHENDHPLQTWNFSKPAPKTNCCPILAAGRLPKPKTSPNLQKAKFAHENQASNSLTQVHSWKNKKAVGWAFAHQNRQLIAVGWRQTMIKNVNIPKSSAEKQTPPPLQKTEDPNHAFPKI
jgi:hypothetical protein